MTSKPSSCNSQRQVATRSADPKGQPGDAGTGAGVPGEKGEGEMRCGIGPCYPPCFQRFTTVLAFSLCLSLSCFGSTLLGPLFVSQITSVERQFQMTSAQSGALLAANDVGFMVLVLLATHFCKKSHIPRILGLAGTVYALASFGIVCLNFMRPQSLKDLSTSNHSLEQNRYLCLPVSRPDPNSSVYLREMRLVQGCQDILGEDGSPQAGSPSAGSSLGAVLLMGFLFSLHGIAKATRVPLGFTYIDDNITDRAQTGFYVGIVLTVMLFGPPLGFGFGGLVSTIPVDLSDTSIQTSDPRWISAWWLGMLAPASLSLLAAVPLFLFPRTLPTHRATGGQKEDVPETAREEDQDGGVGEGGGDNPKSIQNGQQYKPHQEGILNVCFKGDAEDVIQRSSAGLKQIKVDLTGDHAGPKSPAAEPLIRHQSVSEDKVTRGPLAKEDPATQVAHVNGAHGTAEKQWSAAAEDTQNSGSRSGQDQKTVTALKELPVSLCRLLSSPVYVLMVVAISLQVFAFVGSGTFFIKYLEHTFDLQPRLSSYIFGACHLVFNGAGTFLGGIVTSRFVKTRRACMKFVVIIHGVSVVLVALLLIFGCDPKTIVGVNDSDVTEASTMTHCECDVGNFLPVCVGNKTFASPCHAGCTKAVNATHFTNCTLSPMETVGTGVCSRGCVLHLVMFLLLEVVAAFLRSSNVTPIYVTTMRSVSEEDKTLALGLMSFIMSLLGFIPGPIAFGAIVDSTCLVWAQGSCGSKGACAMYDVTKLRFRFLGLEAVFSLLMLVLMCVALGVLWWQLRTGRTKDEELVKDTELSMKDPSARERDEDGKGKKEEEPAASGKQTDLEVTKF